MDKLQFMTLQQLCGLFTADEVVSFDQVDKTCDVLAADFADYIQTSLRQHSFVVLCCTDLKDGRDDCSCLIFFVPQRWICELTEPPPDNSSIICWDLG